MSVDAAFQKELKSMLITIKQNNHSTFSEKHVSWVSLEHDETKNKKQPPSTPFPRKKVIKEDLNLKPTTLSFNDDSKEERSSKKRKVSDPTQEYFDFKQKLSKNAAVSSGLNSGWLEVDVSSPIPASESDISGDDIVPSEIDPEGTLAKEILNKIKQCKVLENASTTDESIDEIFFDADMEQIEVQNTKDFSLDSLSNFAISDSYDSDSSDENIIKVPKIVKNATKFKKQCKIVEFKNPVNSLLFTKENINNKKQIDLKMNSNSETNGNQIFTQRKKKLQKTKHHTTKSPKFKKITINPVVITSTENIEQELSNDKTSSQDQDFLLDNKVCLNSTKEIVHYPIESNEIILQNNNIKFYTTKNHCILILTHPMKLYFYGKINMSVLTGAVEIFGSTFKDNTEDVEIYSPRGQAYLCIKTKETENNTNIHDILQSYNVNEKIDTSNKISVIALKFLKNPIINCLFNHTNEQLFPKVTAISEKRPLSLFEMRLQCYFETESLNWPVLKINEQLEACIDSLKSSKGKIIACGGKDVGKSTFLRFTTNRLLEKFKKVVYIDLDPGQSEFTLPGCISLTLVDQPLLGPNYTHLKKPERCYFLGEVNIAHCFNRYLNAIQELMCFYDKEIDKTLPCLINYLGFTKSLGLDLIASVLYIVNPATLIQIQSNDQRHNYKALLTNDFIKKYYKSLPYKDKKLDLHYELIVLNSIASTIKGKSEFEPKSMRNMNITAYFAQTLTTGNEAIASIPPYRANLSSVNLKHIDGTTENLLAILNGNLVALCVDSVSNCLGFGIIRGIDTNNDKIYIITPENKSILEKINTLVMGTIMLPTSFYKTSGSYEGSHPYICKTIQRATTDVPKRVYTACRHILSQK